jgi:hypothetical protein
MTEFHKTPGRFVDQSNRGPVSLIKQNRVVAMLVNPDDWAAAQGALLALHGNRVAFDVEDMDEETHAILATSRDKLKNTGKTGRRQKSKPKA